MRTYRLFAIAAALAAPLFVTPARAGIEACGNINVEANAKCEAKVGVECTAQCTPVNFELACHGELQASCEGECTATLPSCQGSCEGDCNAECDIDPPSFQCEGSCKADCEGSCTGHCSAETNKAECEGSCKATCSSECTAKCTGTGGSAECSGKCTASCKGSCSAEAHMNCQIQCQSRGYAECQTRLQGGCTAECSKPEGALFCDSNYVDHGGKLAECQAAITNFIKAHVEASASGSTNCEGNTCTAEGKAACKCSRVAPTPATNTGAFTVAGLALAGIIARRRRSRGR